MVGVTASGGHFDSLRLIEENCWDKNCDRVGGGEQEMGSHHISDNVKVENDGKTRQTGRLL